MISAQARPGFGARKPASTFPGHAPGALMMENTFGVLDGVTFVVFALLLTVAVILIVSLGQLPGQLARKWGHPQASAINVARWIGIATGGLLWPLALIWAFITPSRSRAGKNEHPGGGGGEAAAASKQSVPSPKLSVREATRP